MMIRFLWLNSTNKCLLREKVMGQGGYYVSVPYGDKIWIFSFTMMLATRIVFTGLSTWTGTSSTPISLTPQACIRTTKSI